MKQVTNKFGTGELYEINDVSGFIYVRCTACISIYSDFLSWAENNIARISEVPDDSDSIIILGCQVTDLAILNDLKHAEEFKDRNVYMGGCLAQRFDIELPDYIKRLDVVRIENQPINELTFTTVDFAKPFWEKDFVDTESVNDNLKPGHIFRNYYPLKIGAGCTLKCAYCTIRDTRGDYYECNATDQVSEFINNKNVVLISDNPTVKQIKDWCAIAIEYNKEISIRNVEPMTVILCKDELLTLSEKGLLDILHCPIQSNNPKLLEVMDRNSKATMEYIALVPEFRKNGTKVATNIIIDYTVVEFGDTMISPNRDEKFLNANFDYWVWNPYFDGNWNKEKAEARWAHYFAK